MESLEGVVDRIIFHNKENGYTVLSIINEDDEFICVGTFHYISEGLNLSMEGKFITHQSYGEQFLVDSVVVKQPSDLLSIEKYLGSGAIKGIGVQLASRIIKRFKEETMNIIENEPERLAEVKGISENKAREIGQMVTEKKDLADAMIFMQKYGISANLSIKIYNHYGKTIYNILENNPYKLADDINGIGFKIADEIAMKQGISINSDYRIRCAIIHTLNVHASEGNVCLPISKLSKEVENVLLIGPIDIDNHLMDMVIDKKLVIKDKEGEKFVYVMSYYYAELNIAKKLIDLNLQEDNDNSRILETIDKLADDSGIALDDGQRDAVLMAVNNGLTVITGGPGTGKTTTINMIIKYFEKENLDIRLAAPTGRAAKRMTETTGCEAQTIHRMLEMIVGGNDNNSQETISLGFSRNESNPIEADVIIIDEMSMVDIFLMNALLKAIVIGTKLILVGDSSQLPSVGPGNVLKDIINSNKFSVSKLTKIFRQSSQSDIVVNAHKINNGEKILLDNNSKDFLMVTRDEPNAVINAMLTIVKEKLPDYVKADVSEIQVLTPMRKGLLGVINLNNVLQAYLNPKSDMKKEKIFGSIIFREGDRVMQTKNNYQIEWEVVNKYGIPIDKGTGIYNGDMGIIRKINTFSELIEIEFDDKKIVQYSFSKIEELDLSYAITIHKAQGSEYPAVVLPLLNVHAMLSNRNLLYTAVTRAKSCVCIIGKKESVYEMINNVREVNRYSGLKDRILEFL